MTTVEPCQENQSTWKLILTKLIKLKIKSLKNKIKAQTFTPEEITSILAARENATKLALEKIANNTQEQLAKLKVKYAIPDSIKTVCGYTAIICITLTITFFVLNDSCNLIRFLRAPPPKVKPKPKITKPVYKQARK